MWTRDSRGRMAEIARKTKRYPSDLTEEDWERIEPAFLDFVVEIVRRIDGEPGFKVLPRRWVVERTFGSLVRWRRLVRDFEQRLDVSEAMIHVAMGSLLLRRIAHQ